MRLWRTNYKLACSISKIVCDFCGVPFLKYTHKVSIVYVACDFSEVFFFFFFLLNNFSKSTIKLIFLPGDQV